MPKRAVHRMARRTQGKPDLDLKHLDAAIDSMLLLNRAASQAGRLAGVRAATDITGFGLLGHASEMATAAYRQSGAGFVVHAASIPVLDGVWDYIAAGYMSGATGAQPQLLWHQRHLCGGSHAGPAHAVLGSGDKRRTAAGGSAS